MVLLVHCLSIYLVKLCSTICIVSLFCFTTFLSSLALVLWIVESASLFWLCSFTCTPFLCRDPPNKNHLTWAPQPFSHSLSPTCWLILLLDMQLISLCPLIYSPYRSLTHKLIHHFIFPFTSLLTLSLDVFSHPLAYLLIHVYTFVHLFLDCLRH